MSPRTEAQFEAIRQESREAILDAALKLFAKKGFSRTTTADIAREAGISKGLIYNYFRSKEGILDSLIDQFMVLMIPFTSPKSKIVDPAGTLERIIRNWFSLVRAHPEIMRLSVQIQTDASLFKLIRRKQTQYEPTWMAFFRKIFHRLGSPDPDVDTIVLGSIWDGIGLNYAASPDSIPLDRVERYMIERFCTTYRKRRR